MDYTPSESRSGGNLARATIHVPIVKVDGGNEEN